MCQDKDVLAHRYVYGAVGFQHSKQGALVMRLELAINPRKVGIALGIIAVYFALQSIIVEYLIENILDNELHRSLVQVIDLFSVNAEQTIPTWYATLLLFGASV